MIPRELLLFPGLRLKSSAGWLVEVKNVTWNGIVQWTFVDCDSVTVYGAPLEWVYRAWSLA